jgi:hypothetical protein
LNALEAKYESRFLLNWIKPQITVKIMVKTEIKDNPDGTSTLYVDDQEEFIGDRAECEEKAVELYEETMRELGQDLSQ